MNSKLKKYDPHLDITVKGGLPCGVVIDSYMPYLPPTWLEPPEGPEIQWFFIDSKGYKADWLFDQLTQNEIDEIEAEIYEALEKQ